MKEVIDQIAKEAGIGESDANYIFTVICSRIAIKVPALQKVINDVFEDKETDELEKDINEMVKHLQEQQWKEKFKTWIIPQRNTEKENFAGNGDLF